MNEFLPSIRNQKGLNYNNNIHNHQRFSSVDNTKNNIYKNNYNNYKNNNYRIKQEINNNNNFLNNVLKIANTNKDEINSIKNNTAITYYNKSYLKKNTLNNKNLNNIFPETYYNYYQKYKAKKAIDNISAKSYSNIKIIQGNINMNNIHKDPIKNLNLFLPDFPKNNGGVNNNNKNNQKTGYAHSYSMSVSNRDNKSKKGTINNINNNSIYNLKNNNNLLKLGKIDSQKIIPKITDNLTTIGFLQNRNINMLQTKSNTYTRKRGLSSTDNQFMKPYKTSGLFNKNITNKKKKCPICEKEVDKYRYKCHFNFHPSKIFNWLYLGSYRNACDKQEIKDIGINYVLNCAVECLETFPVGVHYCHLKLSDMPSFKILPHLERATSFINQAQINNGIILVHCQLGISRSTSCVIAYMIKYMGYTAMNALDFIKKKRTQVMPNFGFIQQLKTYEKNHRGEAGGKREKEKENENTEK